MAKQRIISAQSDGATEELLNLSLRPQRLGGYVGQRQLVQKLTIALEAVQQRGEPMEHILLHGPPGLGKTTLAHIIAAEMNTHLVMTSGPALTRPTDLVGALTKLQSGDVLFIDEIHRLSPVVEEYIYPAMEDFKISVIVDSGMHAKPIEIPIKPFCLIGATTRAGLLSGPMRSRFGISHHLEFYDADDLLTILHRNASLLNMNRPVDKPTPPTEAPTSLSLDCLQTIAKRSRGTPRIANRLLRRVRDYAQVRADGALNHNVVDRALRLEGVDERGLDETDRKYLKVIGSVYDGGPVGLEAIAATLNEDAGTLEEMVEPFLLQIGFLARTRKGRQLTPAAGEHLGVKVPVQEQPLFQDAAP